MDEGACSGHAGAMFPLPGDDAAIAAAKALCAVCPVQIDCLEWALRHREEHGVWGGTDEDERRALRRRLHQAAVRVRDGGPEQLSLMPPEIDPKVTL